MYEFYDTFDNRTVRVFVNREQLRRWLASSTLADWMMSRGYSWRRM